MPDSEYVVGVAGDSSTPKISDLTYIFQLVKYCFYNGSFSHVLWILQRDNNLVFMFFPNLFIERYVLSPKDLPYSFAVKYSDLSGLLSSTLPLGTIRSMISPLSLGMIGSLKP